MPTTPGGSAGALAVRPEEAREGLLGRMVLAAASTAAGVIHLAVIPEHFEEWMLAGVFFVALAVFQLLWALLVVARPQRLALAAGVVVNAAVIAVWAISRTGGFPWGPHAGEPEAVGALDLAATAFEALIVVGSIMLAFPARERERRHPVRAFAVSILAVLMTTMLTAVSVASDAERPHPVNANEGYGNEKVVRFQYPQQYFCTTEAFDDLDGVAHQGDGVVAAQDPDEFQVPLCIVGETRNGSLPGIGPTGEPIQNVEPLWVIVPFFDADHDGIIDAEDPDPGVDTQCPEPGPPFTQHKGAFGTCSMHPSLLHGEPAGLADIPLPNLSHIVDGTNFGFIWWWIISVRVFDENIWPNFNGGCPASPGGGEPCLTSLQALRAAQARKQAGPDVATNLFLFFDSREVDLP
jgi:hypothetical protein